MAGIAIWLTGLPGSGKSTIAEGLLMRDPALTVLSMDSLRKLITPAPTYSDAERDIVYRAIVAMAGQLTALGHDVLIDATGNRRLWRDLARTHIPRFAEVYLRCPVEICMTRESSRKETHHAPAGIYRKGAEGCPVPGLTAPYEEPLDPELALDTQGDAPNVDVEVEAVMRLIDKMRADNIAGR